MLRIETIEPNTFSILIELMQMPALNEFHLVGGTALALFYGHRLSVDLDLFSTSTFSNDEICSAISSKFNNRFSIRSQHPNFGIFGFIDDVKSILFTIPCALT